MRAVLVFDCVALVAAVVMQCMGVPVFETVFGYMKDAFTVIIEFISSVVG